MKKKILSFIMTIFLLIPCAFMISACEDDITDCAYVQFVPSKSDEVVQYTAYASNTYTHIYLFDSEKTRESGSWDTNYLLKISFKRNLGVDYEIDEEETLCVDIENWYSMQISIKKEYYDASKKVYLNGEDITSKADSTLSKPPEEESTPLGKFWHDGVFYFEDFGLVKGNDSNYINKIEYK